MLIKTALKEFNVVFTNILVNLRHEKIYIKIFRFKLLILINIPQKILKNTILASPFI